MDKKILTTNYVKVILVDDGIATGSTMLAAIKYLKKQKAKVIVAVPIAPPSTVSKIKKIADEVIALYTPFDFMAIGLFYEEFPQTEDDEVITLLGK